MAEMAKCHCPTFRKQAKYDSFSFARTLRIDAIKLEGETALQFAPAVHCIRLNGMQSIHFSLRHIRLCTTSLALLPPK